MGRPEPVFLVIQKCLVFKITITQICLSLQHSEDEPKNTRSFAQSPCLVLLMPMLYSIDPQHIALILCGWHDT